MGKRVLLISLLFFSIFSDKIFASHLMGGEITWTCEPSHQFRFHMKLYRDCNGITPGSPITMNTDAPGHSSGWVMNLISQTDNSPTCNGPGITCAQAEWNQTHGGPSIPGAVEEYIYESGLITLNGVPPATGWT